MGVGSQCGSAFTGAVFRPAGFGVDELGETETESKTDETETESKTDETETESKTDETETESKTDEKDTESEPAHERSRPSIRATRS